jgi:hypothetical protein
LSDLFIGGGKNGTEHNYLEGRRGHGFTRWWWEGNTGIHSNPRKFGSRACGIGGATSLFNCWLITLVELRLGMLGTGVCIDLDYGSVHHS